tara:strand:- start:1415 stop:2449 length:1035 start_codon:yes stop_codon:yes gene_type:complete
MIITKTPLRITFTGGGSDMPSFFEKHDGHCINATIDKYVYVLVKKRSDNKIYLKYSDNEVVDTNTIFEIQHDFIRETLIYLGVDYGLEIINWADIPTKGSGLGSSGSFLVGLLNAIHTLEGNYVSKQKLAQQASHIEMVLCGKPIGYQDQYAAAYGGLNEITFTANEYINDYTANERHEVKVTPLIKKQDQLNLISQNLLLFYTGITRESSTVLEDQNKNLMSKDDSIIAMKENVRLSRWLVEHLHSKEYKYIGHALRMNWNLKLKFSDKIVNKDLIKMYETAREGGATGGKIIGAGGGGFMMFYVERAKQQLMEKVVCELGDYRAMDFKIDCYGSRVLLNVET